ncbi:hypothetical protein [Nocardia macrotermitis]|uniref:WXG100 family type VII secretion target n=1 Tax=Nocardia macrotermitis TaxID=2585198 RepID=A0A7K0D9Q1_9NOCA|nr:hypothetical protein [Nocardia macrotermitis]MQY22495.1 hypothetical protein [Nocardia macrotermitis]
MASDSSEPLEVDTNGLTVAGKNFQSLGVTVQSLVTNLNESLNALGECWGHDHLGKQFSEGENGYLKAKEALIGASGALQSFETMFTMFGDDAVQAGKAFQNGEDAYGEEFIKNIGATGSGG